MRNPALPSTASAASGAVRSPFHDSLKTLAAALPLGVLILALTPGLPAQQLFAELRGEHLPRAPGVTAIATGDVDGDGDLDLVVGSAVRNALWLHDRGGVFVDATAGRLPAAASATHAIALIDVDGDLDLDVFAANETQDQLFVNDGTGTFRDATAQLPVDPLATSAAAFADVEGDGDADLWLGADGARTLRLLLNDGRGRFAAAPSGNVPPNTIRARELRAVDVDGDGDADLLIAEPAGLALLRNDGTGVFADDTAASLPSVRFDVGDLVVADFDSDNDPDLFVPSPVIQDRLFINQGNGTFVDATAAWVPIRATTASHGSTALDFDGDGDLDLFVGQDPRRSRLLVNVNGARFAAAPIDALPIIQVPVADALSADFDGDGAADVIAVTGPITQPRILFGDGAGRFVLGSEVLAELRGPIRAGGPTSGPVLGDLDGDGDLDLLELSEGRIHVAENDGTGRLHGRTGVIEPTGLASGFALGDLDGDGDLDLYVGTRIFLIPLPDLVYFNRGDGTFSGPHDADDAPTECVELFDADGDGDLDAFLGTFPFPNVAVDRLLLNDGSGGFTAAPSNLPSRLTGVQCSAAGDVDGDGDADLLLAERDGVRIYQNDGSGRFTDITPSPSPFAQEVVRTVALRDVDGDADPDVLTSVGSVLPIRGPVRLYRNLGGGSFAEVPASQFPAPPAAEEQMTAFVDADADGDLDVFVVQNRGARTLLINDGRGVFVDASAALPHNDEPSLHGLFVGDVDGDGDDDVLQRGRVAHLWSGLARELHVPLVPRPGGTLVIEVQSRPRGNPNHRAITLLFAARLVPVRIALPPFGALGLDPATAFVGGTALPDPRTGTARVTVAVPAQPVFAGLEFFGQALIEEGTSPFDARLTRPVSIRVRR